MPGTGRGTALQAACCHCLGGVGSLTRGRPRTRLKQLAGQYPGASATTHYIIITASTAPGAHASPAHVTLSFGLVYCISCVSPPSRRDRRPRRRTALVACYLVAHAEHESPTTGQRRSRGGLPADRDFVAWRTVTTLLGVTLGGSS